MGHNEFKEEVLATFKYGESTCVVSVASESGTVTKIILYYNYWQAEMLGRLMLCSDSGGKVDYMALKK